MDTVVYDRIEDVLGRIESLYGRVEDTYLVAKDILLGTQISDWIADLKASGTASATYSDASRMNALIANEDAVNNVDVTQYLCDWAVSNNKTGVYFGSIVGDIVGVDWSALSTADSIMTETVFGAIANDHTAFGALSNNTTCARAMYNAHAITEDIINESQAINQMSSVIATITNHNPSQFEYLFLRYFDPTGTGTPAYSYSVTFADGSQQSYEVRFDSGNVLVNRFVRTLVCTEGSGRSTLYGKQC